MRLSDRRFQLNGEMSCIVVEGHDEKKEKNEGIV